MITKGCVALSMQLHTGVDCFLSIPLDELNEIAETVSKVAEEVAQQHGKK